MNSQIQWARKYIHVHKISTPNHAHTRSHFIRQAQWLSTKESRLENEWCMQHIHTSLPQPLGSYLVNQWTLWCIPPTLLLRAQAHATPWPGAAWCMCVCLDMHPCISRQSQAGGQDRKRGSVLNEHRRLLAMLAWVCAHRSHWLVCFCTEHSNATLFLAVVDYECGKRTDSGGALICTSCIHSHAAVCKNELGVHSPYFKMCSRIQTLHRIHKQKIHLKTRS